MLDREVADATGGIEHPRCRESAGGTGVETARAPAAPVGLERRARREVELHEQRRQEHERPGARRDEHGILAEPAQTGPLRQVAFEHGAAVHVGARVHGAAKRLLQPVVQKAHPLPQHHMVVVAARIPRDRPRWLAAAIRRGHHERVSGAGVRPCGVPPQLGPCPLEVRHRRLVSRREPGVECRASTGLAQTGHAGRVEPEAVGLGHEAPAQRVRGQGWRPTHRAKAITSSAGGMAPSSPYAV